MTSLLSLVSGNGKLKEYKSCDAARCAFRDRDVDASRREHMKPMHPETHMSSTSEYIKSIVFGGLDGIMTTFAVIAAAAGSNGNFTTVLIFGFSNMLADGFSMGFGEYVSSHAELENARAERAREEWEVENSFDLEVDEMVQIYVSKGISFEDATTIVGIISKDPKLFVDFMMVEELGLIYDMDDTDRPRKQGIIMFLSFIIFGSIPLFAYLPQKGEGADLVFLASCILTMVSLTILGSVKGYLLGLSLVRSALLMILNGTISGIVSFSVSYAIEGLMNKAL